MARRIPETRFEDLAAAAARVFTRSGYKQSQMSEIAKEMGVSAGTLYLYVEGKEALLEMVLRHSVGRFQLPPAKVPIPKPEPGATLVMLQEGLEETAIWPNLVTALAQTKFRGSIESEIASIVRELYDLMWQYRTALLLLSRCSVDWPEFANVVTGGVRSSLQLALQRYLDMRVASKHVRALPSPQLTAVFLVETLTWWTLERPAAPNYKHLGDDECRDMVVDQLLHSLLPAPRKS